MKLVLFIYMLVPLSFITASVIALLNNHPGFSIAFMIFAFFTIPSYNNRK